jgi:hypothetical protein
MSIIKVVAALVVLTLLAGCKNVQTCNDSKAKESVLQIITQNTLKFAQKGIETALNQIGAEAELVGVKTTDSNEKLGVYECSANYTAKYNGVNKSAPVTYQLSHLEDSNTTEVVVHWIALPSFSQEIVNVKSDESAKLISDYITKRGSQFADVVAFCIDSKISSFAKDHGVFSYTANNLAEWDKVCGAEVDEYSKFVSNFVTKRGGEFTSERARCITYSSLRENVQSRVEDHLTSADDSCKFLWPRIENQRMLSDYQNKRGSLFSQEIATCLNEFITPFTKQHGDYKYTVDNLAEWDKSCTAKIAATSVTR